MSYNISQVSINKISITLLLFFVCLGKDCSNPNAKVQKIRDNLIYITDFILIYNLISRFCFLVGAPNACINSSFFRLNQLMCETPSMLRLKLPSLSSFSEHIVLSALKCWLNSREYSSPLMETSLNVHSFLITASPKFSVSRKNLMVGISFST